MKWLSGIIISLILFVGNLDRPFATNRPTSLESKTSHMLVFLVKGEEYSGCTGTAIGPHAILTASHCNEEGTQINIDFSTVKYKIVDSAEDGRDHIIYLLDGPAFTNIEPYSLRKPAMGEEVFIYGSGHHTFPGEYKKGKVLNESDPSDVNKQQHIFYSSIDVIPGDSGSVIYGKDGKLLGIVTYRMSRKQYLFFNRAEAAGFELNFEEETIKYAQTF